MPAKLGARTLNILRDVDEHRPRASRPGDVKRLPEDVGEILDLRDQVVVLGERDRDAGDVRLLEGIGADRGSGTWPVMQTIGEESIIAVPMPVTRLVAPGPLVAIATPTRPVTRA